MASKTCDFVIVGGGTGGLALACRLAEIPQAEVTLIEAGDNLVSDPRILTPALWQLLLNTPANWGYKTVPQSGLHDREVVCTQGRLLGGSSGLNALVFSVNAKSNIEAWGKLGNQGWDWTTFERYLHRVYSLTKPSEKTVETLGLQYINKQDENAKGPVQLSWTDDPEDEWPRVWRDTFTNMGFPLVGDPFKGDAHGVFFTAECIDPATKQRSYAANTYLKKALDKKNLKIITNASVSKIILDISDPQNVVATGVEFTRVDSDVVEVLNARREVILAAGAIKSPEILELSGIGNPKICNELGVSCVISNPGVGENLQNHVCCGLSFEVEESCKTIDPLARGEPEAIRIAGEQYAQGRGPMASSSMFLHCQLPFPNISTEAGKRDLRSILETHVDGKEQSNMPYPTAHREYVEGVLKSDTEGSGVYLGIPGYAGITADGSSAPIPEGSEKYFTVAVLLAHPLSRGSVHCDRSSPHGVRIDPQFLTHPVDIEVFARHARNVEEAVIKTQPLAGKLVPGGKRNMEKYPLGSLSDLETAKEYIKDATFGSHHFTSSCAMMPREVGGVVDDKLRVHGCKNLRICDASIMPFIPRANPQSTVYAIAEAANDFIRTAWYS